jgi:hypothetical protein
MASRLTRSVPVTVNDVLDGHVQLGPGLPGPPLPARLPWTTCRSAGSGRPALPRDGPSAQLGPHVKASQSLARRRESFRSSRAPISPLSTSAFAEPIPGIRRRRSWPPRIGMLDARRV